jgi:hypothetical protein
VKPVYQTKFGAGEGNCLQAALASVLELDLEDVPNFAEYGNRFWPEVWKWLAERNIVMLSINNNPLGYHLMTVKSPRIEGLNHALVCLDGKPIHDPHPEGNCQHNGVVSYDVLYPLDPAKPFGMNRKEAH